MSLTRTQPKYDAAGNIKRSGITVRLTPDRDAGREIIVIVGPGPLVSFRLAGTRKVYESTARTCYEMAVKAEKARALAVKRALNPTKFKRKK